MDTSSVPRGHCAGVASVGFRYLAPLAAGKGCTNRLAENYDASALEADGSCRFLGGRGAASASWSAMSGEYKLDKWHPTEEYSTWAIEGRFCSGASKGLSDEELAECFQVHTALASILSQSLESKRVSSCLFTPPPFHPFSGQVPAARGQRLASREGHSPCLGLARGAL